MDLTILLTLADNVQSKILWYSFSWDVMHYRLVTGFKTAWPLIIRLIGCPKTLVTIYQSVLCNNPEDLKPQLHHGRSMKSHLKIVFTWTFIQVSFSRLLFPWLYFIINVPDPEEFLTSLIAQILRAEPFLKLSSGQEAYHYQLFVEKDEHLLLPSVQQLFEQSFLASDIKLKEVLSK